MIQTLPTELNKIKSIITQNLPFVESDFGKMIRSKIGVAIIKSYNLEPTLYLDFLACIELIHNASLLHDDVIDDETTRRGRENIKTKHNNKTSILYGDLILTNALELLSTYENINIIKHFNQTVSNMCKGELLQNNQLYTIPTFEKYIEKSKLKTASLFEFLIIGLHIISHNKISLKTEFGTNFGIAFQIKNDLDNIKENNSDILNGIYTAPVIYSNSIDITSEALEKTQCLIDNYRSKCITNLSEIEDNEYKKELIGVVECLKS